MTHLIKTRTEDIYSLSAPYANTYQGVQLRVVFVCQAGLLRSPTAAHIAAKHRINSRCAGIHEKALQPLSMNLLAWADKIVFLEARDQRQALLQFAGTPGEEFLATKSLLWDVPDQYDYMEGRLVALLEPKIQELAMIRSPRTPDVPVGW